MLNFMNKNDFEKMWKKFLIDVEKSETTIAHEIGTSPSNLNQKIKNHSIKYLELSNIVEKYGYNIVIKKDK